MSEIGVGTVLDNTYEVVALIGQGGMGQVWSAQHKRLPKMLAVKVLLGALQDSEGYARFRREAEIASRIGHPNIVEVLDFNTLPSGTPYLVMEYLEGESLARRLKKGPMPLAEVLGLARQIGSALHAAHKHQVVHRDLKPDNIYLCPSDAGGVVGDRVKVLDFGISKIRNAATVLTQESTLMGTPQYMSPEQASGKNQLVDQRTDVFALGAILYEMLCGKPAFAGETLATVVVKVMLEAPPPIEELQPAVPAAVRGAVMRALEKDPQKRFPDVASFIGELTGSPLQTLDRRPAVTPEVNPGFLPTEAPGTPVPPTNPPDPFGSTAAGVPTPAPATPSLAGSLARGEVAIPTEPVVQKKRGLPMLWIALAGVVVLGGGAFVLLRAPSPPPQENQKNDEVEARLRELEQKLKEQKKAPEPSKPPEIMVAANDVPVVAAKPVAANAAAPPPPPTRPVAAAPKHETLPPEVAAELADAEAKLGGGDPREALRLARHSLLAQKSGRAFSVIARALCKQGDLGGARAALHSVDKNDLARVKRECKAAGIDL